MSLHPHSSTRATALAAVLGLAVGATLMPPAVGWAADKLQDVFVTNDTANPVPVVPQGTTNVSGNVGLTGPVTVQNTAESPLHVTSPAAASEIFRESVFVPITGPSRAGETELFVPDGKLLTLEHVSSRAGSDVERITLIVGTGEARALIEIPLQPGGVTGGPNAASEHLNVLVGPGEPISVFVRLETPQCSGCSVAEVVFLFGQLSPA